VEHPEKIAVSDIEKEGNAEVRRVMIDQFGPTRFVQEGGSRLLSEDEFGKLWRKDMLNDEPIVMVEVQNSTPEPDGSFKTYFLRVPPTITTAHEAVAWTFDVPVNDYRPQKET
jgi:hypothetical protein